MNTDLLGDLDRLGNAMKHLSAPITVDELARLDSQPNPYPVDSVLDVSTFDTAEAVVQPFRVPGRRSRRPMSIAVALGAAAAFIGVLVVTTNRTEPHSPANSPNEVPAAVLQPSATPGKIDNFPILDDQVLPANLRDGHAVGTWSNSTEDQGWTGYLGVPAVDEGGVPTSLVSVQAGPGGLNAVEAGPGLNSVEAGALTPGRIEGVSQLQFANDNPALLWSVNAVPLAIAGPDIDLLYSLIPHIQPVNPTPSRGGYSLVGVLPSSLEELDAPRHYPIMWEPGLTDDRDDGSLNLSVGHLSPLALIQPGKTDVRPVAVGPYRGYVGYREGHIDLSFAINSDESVFISTTTMNESELIELASRIRYTDESTWREHYGVAWGGDDGKPLGATDASIEPEPATTVMTP